jgi:hypothetical protein
MTANSDDMPHSNVSGCLFTYYPGISTGYSGFTDHNAMRCDLNNWLLKEADDMQYWLAGFGSGFVQAVLRFCEDNGSADDIHRLTINSDAPKIIESVDWLQRLQLSGVDTGSPSTANLSEALDAIFQRLENEGPIRHDYWKKRDENDSCAADNKEFRAEKLYEARQRGLDVSLSFR